MVNRLPLRLFVVAVSLGIVLGEERVCLTTKPQFLVRATDQVVGDYFGWSVAVSGNQAVIGAKGVDTQGENSGSAYVYSYDGTEKTWKQDMELVPSDGKANGDFGQSVAMSSGVLLVGAHMYSSKEYEKGAGAVYVYVYGVSGWTEGQKLMADNPMTDDYFGRSIAVSGNIALVGSHNDDEAAVDSGAVYMYENVGQVLVRRTKLTPTGNFDYVDARFGYSVAVSSGVIVVGAPGDTSSGMSTGSAFLFRSNGTSWVEVQKLVIGTASPLAMFGSSVAVHNGLVAVGAKNPGGKGSVTLFRQSLSDSIKWESIGVLEGEDSWFGDQFGASVSVFNGVVVVGAPYADDVMMDSGAAFVFSQCNDEWVQARKVLSKNRYPLYGNSVSVSDGFVLVGHPLNNLKGAAIFYELDFGDVDFVPTNPDVPAASMVAALDNRFQKGSGTQFGVAVASDENIAVIGSPGDDIGGRKCGSVTVMKKLGKTWLQETKLTPLSCVSNALFGYSVAIEGDAIVVGAIGTTLVSESEGAAYVFRKDVYGKWVQKQMLSAYGDLASQDYFGFSVSISNGLIAVSAPLKDGKGDNIGAVYVFKLVDESWIVTQKISGFQVKSRFGFSVALQRNVLLVGAPFEKATRPETNLLNSGAVYLFRHDDLEARFTLVERLTEQNETDLRFFGKSVAIDGSTAVIGVRSSTGGRSNGGAHIYDISTTSAQSEAYIEAEENEVPAKVNGIVSVGGGVVALAGNNLRGGHAVGFLFTKESGSWAQSQVLEDKETSLATANSISISGNILLVGLPTAHGVTVYNLVVD